jgi:hypothetical protein
MLVAASLLLGYCQLAFSHMNTNTTTIITPQTPPQQHNSTYGTPIHNYHQSPGTGMGTGMGMGGMSMSTHTSPTNGQQFRGSYGSVQSAGQGY